MKKNIYSLVLSESVVDAVDRLAYSMHTSRSNLINQILAERVCYVTPEKRMRLIFDELNAMIAGKEAFTVLGSPSPSILQIRSALAFKYNPTVRYNLEFYRSGGPASGELQVSLRTQNTTLMLYMAQFFKLWAKIEQSYGRGEECAVDGGRFIKKLTLSARDEDAERAAERFAHAIYDYLNAFDEGMKAFFYQLNDPAEAARSVEEVYRAYLQSTASPL